MLTEKANAICLLEVLKEYSDAEHILPMRRSLQRCSPSTVSKSTAATVCRGCCAFDRARYDISLYEDNGVGYYLRSRELEQSEVLLLTDAVYAFPFIPPSADRAACPKTAKAAQCPPAEKVSLSTVARQGHKTGNRQVFGILSSWMRPLHARRK